MSGAERINMFVICSFTHNIYVAVYSSFIKKLNVEIIMSYKLSCSRVNIWKCEDNKYSLLFTTFLSFTPKIFDLVKSQMKIGYKWL